ncbi:MAG TPA: Rieske 2Fe-2S domain-containing protein [Planctomycetaceae bacterium]|nr:Rieske 2Fe-2S domain-containing protein [Planctomycetaceae bacterium]
MHDEEHSTTAGGPGRAARDAERSDPHPPQPRRGFLAHALTLAIGGVVSLFPLVLGLVTFLDPLRKRRGGPPKARSETAITADDEGFFAVARADALPADGTPQFFQIIADRNDAWTFIPNQPIGAVYLRRHGEEIIAYNVQCPHAGCAVDYNPVGREFDCPCHKSSFTLGGERSLRSPSARDLDRLDVRVEDGAVLVKYQNFRTGTAQKIAE